MNEIIAKWKVWKLNQKDDYTILDRVQDFVHINISQNELLKMLNYLEKQVDKKQAKVSLPVMKILIHRFLETHSILDTALIVGKSTRTILKIKQDKSVKPRTIKEVYDKIIVL